MDTGQRQVETWKMVVVHLRALMLLRVANHANVRDASRLPPRQSQRDIVYRTLQPSKRCPRCEAQEVRPLTCGDRPQRADCILPRLTPLTPDPCSKARAHVYEVPIYL
jgi:hypothetical protein